MYITGKKKVREWSVRVRARGGTADLYTNGDNVM